MCEDSWAAGSAASPSAGSAGRASTSPASPSSPSPRRCRCCASAPTRSRASPSCGRRGPLYRLPVPFVDFRVWLLTGLRGVARGAHRPRQATATTSATSSTATAPPRPTTSAGWASPTRRTHTRLRKIVTPEFTMRRLARLMPDHRGHRRRPAGRDGGRWAPRSTSPSSWRSRCRSRRSARCSASTTTIGTRSRSSAAPGSTRPSVARRPSARCRSSGSSCSTRWPASA